ncbi:MAG: TetR/AcrR family transcriptional regulator [Spirochaetota bacterium]
MTRAQDKQKKRKSILRAALKVFSSKGYNPAIIEDVAQEAGVAKGTVYLYFKDKEDLFYHTVTYVLDDLGSIIYENIDPELDTISALEEMAFLQLEFFFRNRDFFGIFHTMMTDNPSQTHKKLFQAIQYKKAQLIEHMGKIVKRGKNQGMIRPELCSEDIIYCFQGAVMYMLREMMIKKVLTKEEPPDFNIRNRVKSMMNIFTEGICRKDLQEGSTGKETANPGV